MTNSGVDLAVIGGGEAGIAAAVQAAEMGAKTCLIEKSPQLGGACVATGTLPSKTFSISAGMLELAQKLENFGVRIRGSVSLDFKEVLASRLRLSRCDQGLIQTHLRSHRVEVIKGQAFLRDKNLIAVEADEGNIVEVEAPRIILATGSQPTQIPGFPTDGKAVLTTDDLIRVSELPSAMLIVGAGVIGCEYAFIFRTFGVEVTLIEKLSHALVGQDKDIVTAIERELKRRGVRYLRGTTLTSRSESPEGRLLLTTDKGEQLTAEMVIVCTGRKPATEMLRLPAVGVDLGLKEEILVDAHLETTAPGIFAAGDVIGRRMVSSTAILEGAVAAENALGGNQELDERFVASGIYTMPEIGAVGLTEDEAAAQGIPIIIGKCPYSRLVKACSLYSHAPGLIKMIFERDSHRLLGAHIIGTEAAEIIHLVSVALRLGAKAEDFVYSIYHHPSISEGFREAARDALNKFP
jgi:dihydrolipoamide dehydrogenase